MENKKIFKTDFLKYELDLPGGKNTIEETMVDQTRWSTVFEIIFEYEGKFWKTYYSCGSTEMQNESPWEFESTVEAIEVEKREVVIEKWLPIIKK